MDRKRAKQLRAISQKVNIYQADLTKETLSAVKAHLQKRGHRADLEFVTRSHKTAGYRFQAEIKFDPQLGYPTEKDVLAVVAQAAPTHDIEWETVDVDTNLGIVYLNMEPSVEMIPVASISSIPPEFISIGAGMYKKAAGASDSIMEVWSLKKTDGGLGLFRNDQDIDIKADEDTDQFRAGDVVDTPDGPGLIKRLDEFGNAFVQVGRTLRLVGASDMQKYDIGKEKQKLVDYYTRVYGDASFAQALLEDYGDKPKK